MSPIHVLASLASDFVPLRRRNANFDLRRRVLCGPAQGKQSGRDPRERFAQAKRKFWPPETRFVWPCAGKTLRPSVSRRRNANFELPRCSFCGPAQAKRKFWPPETHLLSRWNGFTRSRNRMNKIATALQRDAKKNSQHTFRAGETQNLTSGVAFFVALRSKKRGGQKFAPRPKRLYPYRKNPSVWHTVWGNILLYYVTVQMTFSGPVYTAYFFLYYVRNVGSYDIHVPNQGFYSQPPLPRRSQLQWPVIELYCRSKSTIEIHLLLVSFELTLRYFHMCTTWFNLCPCMTAVEYSNSWQRRETMYCASLFVLKRKRTNMKRKASSIQFSY